MSIFTPVILYHLLVLTYCLLCQQVCHTYYKLFSILEIITHGKFIKTIYLYRLTITNPAINIPVPSVFGHELQSALSKFLSWHATVFGKGRLF